MARDKMVQEQEYGSLWRQHHQRTSHQMCSVVCLRKLQVCDKAMSESSGSSTGSSTGSSAEQNLPPGLDTSSPTVPEAWLSQLDQLEQANHAHRQVQGTQSSQVQAPEPTGEANGHSGPEEAGPSPAAEPIAEPIAEEEGEVMQRVQGPVCTMALHGPENIIIAFPGGVVVHLTKLLRGKARSSEELSGLSLEGPATQ